MVLDIEFYMESEKILESIVKEMDVLQCQINDHVKYLEKEGIIPKEDKINNSALNSYEFVDWDPLKMLQEEIDRKSLICGIDPLYKKLIGEYSKLDAIKQHHLDIILNYESEERRIIEPDVMDRVLIG